MDFQIKGSQTANLSGRALCYSCPHAHIFRGSRPSEERIYCQAVYNAPAEITWHITECTSYEDKNLPRLHQLEQIAWRFSADRAAKKMGFLTPAEYRAQNPDD